MVQCVSCDDWFHIDCIINAPHVTDDGKTLAVKVSARGSLDIFDRTDLAFLYVLSYLAIVNCKLLMFMCRCFPCLQLPMFRAIKESAPLFNRKFYKCPDTGCSESIWVHSGQSDSLVDRVFIDRGALLRVNSGSLLSAEQLAENETCLKHIFKGFVNLDVDSKAIMRIVPEML
jgi:hypothetical protein